MEMFPKSTADCVAQLANMALFPHIHMHTNTGNCEQIIFIMFALPLQINDDSVSTGSCAKN